MATDAKQLILGWCSVLDDLQPAGERSEPDSEFALLLTSGGAEVTVSLPNGWDRLVLTQGVDLADGSGSIEADLPHLEEQRPGPVTATASGGQVVISTWIVLDGLTKHSLLSAVSDLSRTRRAVLRLAGAASDTSEALSSQAAASDGTDQLPSEAAATESAAGEPQWAPAAEAATPVGAAARDESPSPAPAEAAAAAAASTGPAPWAAGGGGSGYQPSPASQQPQYQQQQPAPAYQQQATPTYPQQQASPGYQQGSGQGYGGQTYASPAAQPAAPAQSAWSPGHKVPPQGMQAWAAPDPSGAVVATLGGHLPVQVAEMRGAWARVICSNGWTGWVDGRLLVAGP